MFPAIHSGQADPTNTKTAPSREARGASGLGDQSRAYTAGMMLRLTLLAVFLFGCSQEPAKPMKTRRERLAEAEAKIAVTPTPRSYRLDGNELKVIDVPVMGLTDIETQRCFVWRDVEFRTASISCGQMPDIHLPPN